jgi:hypothetical protein
MTWIKPGSSGGSIDKTAGANMSTADAKRDLEALIKATEENRAELKRTQQKMEKLEAAIQAMQNSRVESERKREKTR